MQVSRSLNDYTSERAFLALDRYLKSHEIQVCLFFYEGLNSIKLVTYWFYSVLICVKTRCISHFPHLQCFWFPHVEQAKSQLSKTLFFLFPTQRWWMCHSLMTVLCKAFCSWICLSWSECIVISLIHFPSLPCVSLDLMSSGLLLICWMWNINLRGASTPWVSLILSPLTGKHK